MAPAVSLVRGAFRDAPFIAVGLAAGGMAAFSIAMIAAVGRKRGGKEATWLHMTTLVAGETMRLECADFFTVKDGLITRLVEIAGPPLIGEATPKEEHR